MLVGRVSDSMRRRYSAYNAERIEHDRFSFTTNEEVGYRWKYPSDDLAAAFGSFDARSQHFALSVAQFNINSAVSVIQHREDASGRVHGLLDKVRLACVTYGGPSQARGEKIAFLTELNCAKEELVNLLNERFGDRYVFGGGDSATKPFEVSGGILHYHDMPSNEITGGMLKDASVLYGSTNHEEERLLEFFGVKYDVAGVGAKLCGNGTLDFSQDTYENAYSDNSAGVHLTPNGLVAGDAVSIMNELENLLSNPSGLSPGEVNKRFEFCERRLIEIRDSVNVEKTKLAVLHGTLESFAKGLLDQMDSAKARIGKCDIADIDEVKLKHDSINKDVSLLLSFEQGNYYLDRLTTQFMRNICGMS